MIARAIGAALAAAATLAWSAAPQVTFRAKRESVRVDVLVTDHGKPVTGLGPGDFDVRDNGVAQTVDLAVTDEAPVNAVLALDMSRSVVGSRLTELCNSARSFIGALAGGDRAGLVSFSQIVRLRAPLSIDRAGVADALADASGSGDTALYDASYAGLVVGASDTGRSLMLVFSDGVDTASWLTADAVHDAARRGDVVVYGVSDSGVPAFLKDLSAETGGSVIEVRSTKDLGAVFLRVLEEFRHRYLLSYSLKDVPRDGWHRLEVKVRARNGLAIKARPGYLAGHGDRN